MLRTWPLLVVLLLAAHLVHGHGPHPHTEAAPDEYDAALAEPLDGFDLFLRKFAPHISSFFSPDEQREFDAAVRHWTTYQQVASGADAEDQLIAARHCAQAQGMILHLLEHADHVWTVDYSEGVLAMQSPGVQTLPGANGPMLVRIAAGDGAPSFRWETLNLRAWPEPERERAFPSVHKGTEWILFDLREAPPEESTFMLQFQPEVWSEPPLPPAVFRVQGKPYGQLLLRVLDENGVSVPAMVRIESTETGTLVRPSSAIEFAPQMDDIAGEPNPTPFLPERIAGEPYPVWLPADLGGPYWCTSGPADMAIPAGEYNAFVRRGFEYLPTRTTFTIEPKSKAQVTVQLDRWIDMPARGWWSGDDHVHSRLMSDDDAERLLTWMEACDLHVANILKMGNPLRTYFQQRGFGRDFRVVRGRRALVPGQEDPRGFSGHIIGLNLQEFVRDTSRYMYTDWLSDEIRGAGGLYGHAHLMRNGFQIDRDMTMMMPQGKSDFGEILQSNILDTALYYEFLNLGYPLTASAGSDVPFSHAMGEVRLYSYLGDADFDVDAWFDAMKRGRTFVTNGPMLEFTVDDAMPGDTIFVDDDRPLVVRARVLGPRGTGAPASLRIMSQGEVLHETRNTDPEVTELSAEISVPAGHGRWIALDAAAIDGTRAHTTPVYVIREGYRFWSREKVPALIANRRATLDGMQAELERFLAWGEGGVSDLNPYLQQVVEQAPGMLERMDHVRGLYDDLEETLVEENESLGQ